MQGRAARARRMMARLVGIVGGLGGYLLIYLCR